MHFTKICTLCNHIHQPCVGSSNAEELWEKSDHEDADAFSIQDSPPPLLQDQPTSSICVVTWLVGFLLLLQARHYIPDSAMNALLKFLHAFFRVLGRSSPVISSMVSSIPSSVYSLGKASGQSTKFVVCPKCHYLYKFNECVIVNEPFHNSKSCTFVRFPHHSQRAECGHILLKKVYFPSGRQILKYSRINQYHRHCSSI